MAKQYLKVTFERIDMGFTLRYSKYSLILITDVLAITGSYAGAFLLRFDFAIPSGYMHLLMIGLPLVVAVKLPLFFGWRLYMGMWRYTSLPDLWNILAATMSGGVALYLIGHLLPLSPGIPQSVYIIDWGLTTMLVAGLRLGIRVYYSYSGTPWRTIRSNEPAIDSGKTKLLILGAGDAGAQLLREVHTSSHLRSAYQVVGFLDDDRNKQHVRIAGVPVLGRIDRLPHLTAQFDQILIAIPTATGAQMRHIVEHCRQTGKPFKTVPGLREVMNGRIRFNTIRDVSLVDLIGREEVQLDRESIAKLMQNKRVLITGAGGSIGSELVRQCRTFAPEALILLDNSEYNLFSIEKACREEGENGKVHAILADIREKHSLDRVFREFRPHIVFHAAAYKHVPIQEYFPWEAVTTNIKGTQHLLDLSDEYEVEKLILVSTDKAVRPTSIMGATKRVAEYLIQGNGKPRRTQAMAVRFGNVLGSSGSVIPVFQDQINRGGPVTVTHPNIKRYFMSIPEAAQLILQAGALGRGGEIFVLQMGQLIKIDQLARELIRLSGHEPDVDIPITYVGLRPGEKMIEELMTDDEKQRPTVHEKIMILQSRELPFGPERLRYQLDELFRDAYTFNRQMIVDALKRLVPEFMPDGSVPERPKASHHVPLEEIT